MRGLFVCNRSLQDEDDLECPELVLLALDLIINHHERFLESQEEERHEADLRAQSPARAGDGDEDQQRAESHSGADNHSGEEIYSHDNQSGTEDLSGHQELSGQENLPGQEDFPGQEDLPGQDDHGQEDLLEHDLSGQEDPGGHKDLLGHENLPGHESPPAHGDLFIQDVCLGLENQSVCDGQLIAEDQPLVEGQFIAEGQCTTLAQPIAIEQPTAEKLDADNQSIVEDQSVAKDMLLVKEDHSSHCQEPVEEMTKNKKRELKEGVKLKMKKCHSHNISVAESNSSTSSVYHTLHSDEDADGSAEEQVSDWEEYLGKEDRKSDVTSGSVKQNLAVSSSSSVNDLCGKILPTNSCDDSIQENVEGSQVIAEPQKSTKQHESADGPSSRVASSLQASQSELLSHAASAGGLCSESEVAHSASLTQCVHALLLLCRSSSAVCRRLHSLGFLSRLLDGFNDLISANNSDYRGKSFFSLDQSYFTIYLFDLS